MDTTVEALGSTGNLFNRSEIKSRIKAIMEDIIRGVTSYFKLAASEPWKLLIPQRRTNE